MPVGTAAPEGFRLGISTRHKLTVKIWGVDRQYESNESITQDLDILGPTINSNNGGFAQAILGNAQLAAGFKPSKISAIPNTIGHFRTTRNCLLDLLKGMPLPHPPKNLHISSRCPEKKGRFANGQLLLMTVQRIQVDFFCTPNPMVSQEVLMKSVKFSGFYQFLSIFGMTPQ